MSTTYKLRTIHLPPSLRAMCGGKKTVEYAAANFSHIISALAMEYGQQVKTFIAENMWNVRFGSRKNEAITPDQIHNLEDHDDIYISPAAKGAGRAGQIILGVLMIVVGIITAFYGNPTSLQMLQGGIMIAGGMMQVYTALNTPKAAQSRAEVDERASLIFNGAVNVLEQGGAVPCVYGRLKTGSVVASAGIYTEQLAYYNSPVNSNPAPNSAFGIDPL